MAGKDFGQLIIGNYFLQHRGDYVENLLIGGGGEEGKIVQEKAMGGGETSGNTFYGLRKCVRIRGKPLSEFQLRHKAPITS